MIWPEPKIQPAGSMDCELYAGAYLASLFGHDVSVEAFRAYRENMRKGAVSLLIELGIPVSWGPYWQVLRTERLQYCWSNKPGYKEWVLEQSAKGAVGYGVIHLIPSYGHGVVILDADSDGVLMADSCRGLVKDSWERHQDLVGGSHSPARVEAWFSKG